MLAIMLAPRFVDVSPAEIYATMLDESPSLCSERPMPIHGEVPSTRPCKAKWRQQGIARQGDSMSATGEISFLEGVNRMFDRAAATLSLPDGLPEQIRAGNNVYQVRFPIRVNGSTKSSSGGVPRIPTIDCRRRVGFATRLSLTRMRLRRSPR